jgi:hypothetical protein
LQQLQGLPNVCEVFEFVERNGGSFEPQMSSQSPTVHTEGIISSKQSFIVMKAQGRNLETIKRL